MAATAAPAKAQPLLLFEDAEATVHTVTTWLTATTAPPPTWHNPAAGTSAATTRTRLHASTTGQARARMAIDVPSWTLGDHTASMLGIYRLQDPAGTTLQTGVFQIALVRRQQQWHVTTLSLDPML